jgi:hypothetical protein
VSVSVLAEAMQQADEQFKKSYQLSKRVWKAGRNFSRKDKAHSGI